MGSFKYATIDIDGESNIATVRVGDLTDVHKDDMRAHFTKNVEPRVVQALSEHFDCPVKVSVPVLDVNSFYPLRVEMHVVLETEDEDRRVKVELNETWLY